MKKSGLVETLADEKKPRGSYEITWIAANLPIGVHLYQIQAENFIKPLKLIFL